LFLFVLTGVGSLASYNAAVQTLVVQQYINTLAKKLGTKISVGSIDVSLFKRLIITDLYVEDLHQDTLLYASKLTVDIAEFSYKEQRIVLDEIELTDTYFNLQKYKDEATNNLRFIIDHFNTTDPDSTKSDWYFAMNTVILNKSKFDYDDQNFEQLESGIDYNHLSISYLDLKLSTINLLTQGIDCKIDRLKFFEQSGFQVDELTCNAKVTSKGIFAEQLKVKTPFSSIDGEVNFLTKTYDDLMNFITDVKINSTFNATIVDFKDLFYFAPALECLDKSLVFEGEVKGTISQLKARNLNILIDDGTRFGGDVDISGLPVAEDMFIYAKVRKLISTKEKLESIPLYPFVKEKFIQLPDNFKSLGTIRFKGNFTGFYHDFVTYGTLKTSLGTLTTDISFKLKNGMPYYKGDILSTGFDLGTFADLKEDLGRITLDVNVDGSGFSKEDLDATLVGNIKKVEIKNYEYNNVEVKGNFKNQIFAGFLAVHDENMSFDFNGSIDLSKEIPELNFVSNIKDAKLAKLHFINSDKKLMTRFSTQLAVNLVGKNMDEVSGDIKFINSRYHDKLDSILVDNVLITSSFNEEKRSISVVSDILDANLEGKFRFAEIVKYAQQFFIRYVPSQIDETHQVTNLSNNINFNIELHNSNLLSKVLFGGIKMSEHTTVSGNYDAEKHKLYILGNSPFIDVYGTEIREFKVEGRATENKLNMMFKADKIHQNDSLYFDNFKVESQVGNDSVNTLVEWKNEGDVSRNEASINIASAFNGYHHISNQFIDSYAYVSDSLWQINPFNEIRRDTGYVLVKDFVIHSENQSLLINGGLLNDSEDELNVFFKQLDLLTFKRLIPEKIISLEGVVDGVASLKLKNNQLIITSDLSVDKFSVNDHLMGRGNLKSGWNPLDQSIKVDGKFYKDDIPTFLFEGDYFPMKEKENFDMKLELYQTDLTLFDKYTKTFISEVEGKANAQVSLTGTPKEPNLNGEVTLHNTSFKVIYLNTKYSNNFCKINISPDLISCDNVAFQDEQNNVALVNGTVFHNWFKDWSVGVGLDVTNFLALNTSGRDNNLYYGKAFVTGKIDIGSYADLLTLDIDVKTEANSILNIPLTDNEDIVESNFIEFVSNDTSAVKLQKKSSLSNVVMNFDLEITPETRARLIFDDQIGDVMESTGSGNINLQIKEDGDLNMFGNYIIKDGDYLFTLQNVINKRFDLEEGGSISWSGSPYDADIDITAVYRLRARLYDLLAGIDTNDVYKKRIPVDLKLYMKNEMMNPDISFDIALPTADEDTKSKVRSILYVSNKEANVQELNKQVFSLLVLNSFLPPPGSESASTRAGVGTTTSSELLSNQLSNMLSKISNDFDVGFNYRPGDKLSNQEVELALSTQFFNDRLILDGNLGYSERENLSSEAQSTNNLIGDISVEYKITKDGKLRVRAFNNSSQFSLVETNSSYTQGLGVSYKEEFDTFNQFWGNLFNRFRKKSKIKSSTN
jgi:hypothetical protein